MVFLSATPIKYHLNHKKMSTIEDVADLDVPLPSSLAQKNERRSINYREVLSIQNDFKNRESLDNQDELACYVGKFRVF